jgi:hypothetical protein
MSYPLGLSLIIKIRENIWIISAWSVVLAGLLLRIMHYLGDRSLCLDEAMLALNILDRSPFDLMRPLDCNQGTPPLFLLLVDATTVLLGPDELVLRLVPLFASIVGIFPFFLIAINFTHKKYLPAQMFIFCFSYQVVYFSQEAKQYSVDISIALGLSYTYMRLLTSDRYTKVYLIILCVAGCVTIWISHPAVFVLAGIGTSMLLLFGHGKSRFSFGIVVFIFVIWILNFIIYYLLFLRTLTSNADLISYWERRTGFMPAALSISALKI